MISLSRDSVGLGDTLTLRWDLPSGHKILDSLQGSDSLSVFRDTLQAGTWHLQPLSVANFGGDTLRSVSPSGDTTTEIVPSFRTGTIAQDSTPINLLGVQHVEVPFPWDWVGFGVAGVAATVLAIWGWKRWRAWKEAHKPPPPPPPPRDCMEIARERLQELAKRAASGRSARETAFEVGELLRWVHQQLHGWEHAAESTSQEWLRWVRAHRPDPEISAVRQFLQEADVLRYADDTSGTELLLQNAEFLLSLQAQLRKEPNR